MALFRLPPPMHSGSNPTVEQVVPEIKKKLAFDLDRVDAAQQ